MSPTPDRFTDPSYLIERQYRDSTNLSARLSMHERFSTNPQPWHRWLLDRMELRGGECVLEAGCGSGDLWARNADRPPGFSLTLMDLSLGMLREARARVQQQSTSLAVADAQFLPFQRQSFDVVAANHMLYHVPDRGQAIGELRRVIRPGGRLVAATNGRAHLRELDDLMDRFLGRARGHDDAEKFGLETGVEQLKQHFSMVEAHRFNDGLRVTETEAIVAYILSIEDDVPHEALSAMRAHLDREIERQGCIEIGKDAGVLIAYV